MVDGYGAFTSNPVTFIATSANPDGEFCITCEQPATVAMPLNVNITICPSTNLCPRSRLLAAGGLPEMTTRWN